MPKDQQTAINIKLNEEKKHAQRKKTNNLY